MTGAYALNADSIAQLGLRFIVCEDNQSVMGPILQLVGQPLDHGQQCALAISVNE